MKLYRLLHRPEGSRVKVQRHLVNRQALILEVFYSSRLSVFRVVKSHKFRWAGHVARAPPTRYVRQVLDKMPTSPRPQGRPREDCVSKDAGLLGIPNWQEACQDRAAWRKTCDAAVGLQAL